MTDYPTEPVAAGSIYRINTGAPLPPGADAVIMVEDTEIVSRHAGGAGEEKEVKVLAQVDAGENVRAAGSDVALGEKVLEQGDVISGVGGELGTLAFVGRRSVRPCACFVDDRTQADLDIQAAVHRRPIVAVLSTGNELVEILDTRTKPTSSFSAIPDSNRPSLLSILHHLHFDTVDLGIIGDTMEATKAALKRGKEEADVIISTGGTSMGVGDLLKPCIEREMNGTVHFGRVAMKPGCAHASVSSVLLRTDHTVLPVQETDDVRDTTRAPDGAGAGGQARLCAAGQPSECTRDVLCLRAPRPAQDGRPARVRVGAPACGRPGAPRRAFPRATHSPTPTSRFRARSTSTRGPSTTASGSARACPPLAASHSRRSRPAASARVAPSAWRARTACSSSRHSRTVGRRWSRRAASSTAS